MRTIMKTASASMPTIMRNRFASIPKIVNVLSIFVSVTYDKTAVGAVTASSGTTLLEPLKGTNPILIFS